MNKVLGFFLSSGNADSVIHDLTFEFYGLSFPEGSGFGVGIGLIAWVLLLADENVAILLLLGIVIAVMLSVADQLIRAAMPTNNKGAGLKYMISFFLVYFFYSSVLNYFYYICALLALIAIIRWRLAGPIISMCRKRVRLA